MSKTSREKKKKSAMGGGVDQIVHSKPSKNDPNGSYTGKPSNPNDKPVQDADDL